MFISRLYIKNFRNLCHVDVKLKKGVTCFVGENNCGKTNLIHAVRLVLDGTISASRRRLTPEDLCDGLSFTTPVQVMIAVEFTDFQGKVSQEALPFDAITGTDKARLTYRFRPSPATRAALENDYEATLPLELDDYRWELVGGGDENLDLDALDWNTNFGTSFSTDHLQQGYLIVLMEALRDVEARLAQPRSSPLQQLLEQRNIPEAEKATLVTYLHKANSDINASTTLESVALQLSTVFKAAVGNAFGMSVSLGLGEPSFTDIARGLKVMLSGYGLKNIDPRRNGLGLNNILFISMYLSYFEVRMAEAKTAGELLLIEEPEAHLHPQLQRVLLNALHSRGVQVFVTTHSTHITAGSDLSTNVILTSGGTCVTDAIVPTSIPGFTPADKADLERYLDATRSTLLFARGVLLVEGPAEQFLIPPLVRRVMNVDLDEEGIAVIPIFGTHFSPYARLFGPEGIKKRCAIVADGDLEPSDAMTGDIGDDVLEGVVPEIDNLGSLENSFVKVFRSQTTLERELTLKGNLKMFADAAQRVGAPRVAKRLQDATNVKAPNLNDLGRIVLRTAKRIGKARFAQVASEVSTSATELPQYISDAIMWLKSNETNG